MKASIIRLPETESTNTYALQLLSLQRPENGCVIITDHQTKGKGQDTNSWESEKGKNLTFSIILYPDFTADQQFIFNKAISIGIYDFLKAELPEHIITIKWPNDIYIGDKKACGILIQNSIIGNKLDYVVVGIGLNVNQTNFRSNAPNPVSLQMITGIKYDPDIVLEKLLNCIFSRYSQVNPKNKQIIENEYHKALYRLLEWHEYLINNNNVIAMITGTNDYGQLLLETKSGEVLVCDLKEVKFIL